MFPLIVFVIGQFLFAALYYAVREEFDPKLHGFEDSLYYSIQTQARVGESQYVAHGTIARLFSTLQIYGAITWLLVMVNASYRTGSMIRMRT